MHFLEKHILSLIICMGLGVSCLFSQKTPKSTYIMPHAGYSLDFVIIETTTIPSTSEPYSYYGIHGGIYYALLHKNDVFSLGIDPSLHAGFNVSPTAAANNELAFDYNFHMPIMLLTRFLRGSTPYSRKPVGFGIGFGVVANHYKRTVSINLNQKSTFLHPGIVAEGNFPTGRGHISVRFRVPIGMVRSKVEYSNSLADREFNFNSWGLSVAYGFEKRK